MNKRALYLALQAAGALSVMAGVGKPMIHGPTHSSILSHDACGDGAETANRDARTIRERP